MNQNGDISRADIARIMSNAALTPGLQNARQQILGLLLNHLTHLAGSVAEPKFEKGTPEYTANKVKMLLNAVGPAAASEAVQYAIAECKRQGKFPDKKFTSDFVTNTKMILNDEPGDGAPSFSNVLRQFLLPRYAYLDFDMIVDPRHKVDLECGYPKFITPIMYRYMYDRDDVAARVNDVYPDEVWANEPCIYDDENENVTTEFEVAVKTLIDERHLLQFIYRIDKLCGVGHYGALLIGIDDGKELDQPVDGIDEFGKPVDKDYRGRPASIPPRQLLYMRPFDEYLSFIQQYETNVNNPRYGQPVMYNLVFLDMTIDAAGASIGTRLNRRVHWTRIVHVYSPNLQSSLVFGVPRMQRVFNRLLDLRKIKGGSAEGMWKGGFPGLAFEVDPQYVADAPEFDKEDFKRDTQEYMDGMTRMITLEGIKANTLAPNVADPEKHVKVQLEAIAGYLNMPMSIFLGIGEGRVNKGEEQVQWNKRLGRHIKMHTTPYVLRAVLDRLIAMRLLPIPKNGKYCIEWPDLDVRTNEDKANLSLKWTQALSQYVASGVIHLIAPQDYLTTILGLKPKEALRIIDAVKALGGWQMLLKVDPSQGAGVNGKRTASESVQEDGQSSTRPTERDSSDKQIEGTES